MRKYRGLTKEGEWVYGWYIYGKRWGVGKEHKIIKVEPLPLENILHTVLPETVGQSTGLCDKNGKKAYAGDKICVKQFFRYDGKHSWFEKVHLEGEIFWSNEYGMWMAKFYEDEDKKHYYSHTFFNDISDWEIIGDIHESPELLK